MGGVKKMEDSTGPNSKIGVKKAWRWSIFVAHVGPHAHNHFLIGLVLDQFLWPTYKNNTYSHSFMFYFITNKQITTCIQKTHFEHFFLKKPQYMKLISRFLFYPLLKNFKRILDMKTLDNPIHIIMITIKPNPRV